MGTGREAASERAGSSCVGGPLASGATRLPVQGSGARELGAACDRGRQGRRAFCRRHRPPFPPKGECLLLVRRTFCQENGAVRKRPAHPEF